MDEMRLRAQKGMGSFRDRGKSLEYRFVYIDKYEQMKRKSVSGKTEEECIEKAMKFFEDLEKINRGVQVDATIPEILKRTFLIDFEKGYTGEQGYSRNLETLKTIENLLGKNQ